MPSRKQPKTTAEKAKAAAEEDAWLDEEARKSKALLDAAAAVEAEQLANAAMQSTAASAPKDGDGGAETEERVKYCCNWCQAANPEMACGRCKTKYCSTECQTKAWPKHKEYCELMMSGRIATERARKVKVGEGCVEERLYNASQLGRYDDIEKIIKEEGGDVNMKVEGVASCLNAAVVYGHTRVCELLLRCGANVNHSEDDGKRPLHAAATLGHAAIVTLLLDKGALADAFNDEGWAAIHFATNEGHAEAVTALLQHPHGASVDLASADDMKVTALHMAAQYGRGKVVKALLAHNAQIDALDSKGGSPFMRASLNAHVSIMKTLLKAGANPLHRNALGGWTCMHFAAVRNDKSEVISLLLAAGVPVDVRDECQNTPLAVAIEESNLATVQTLLDAGADPLLAGSAGVIPMDVARALGNADIIAAIDANIAQRRAF